MVISNVSQAIDETGDGEADVYVYCYLVDVLNEGSQPVNVWATLVPGRFDSGRIFVDSNVDVVPYDYGTAPPGGVIQRVNVLIFTLSDADLDGEIGVVNPASGNEVFDGVPDCSSIRSDNSLRQFGEPEALIGPEELELGGQATLDVYLDSFNLQASQYRVPLWSYSLAPGEDVLLLVYVETDDSDSGTAKPLDQLVMLFTGQWMGGYYLGDAIQLPTG